MELTWERITEEDETLFKEFYQKEQSRSCEHTFTNNLLWAPFYEVKYTVFDDCLLFGFGKNQEAVGFPLGRGKVKEAVDYFLEDFARRGLPFQMNMVTPEQFERLEHMYPEKFEITYDRDAADYVYESEKLISLAGKKLHGKRNHINNFLKEYPDYSYESIGKENIEECMEMAQNWRKENGCEENDEKHQEFCVTMRALQRLDELQLTGGLIRADGRVVAFSIGEPVCEDTFVVHIEKAYADIQGAYPVINQQFVKHEASQYKYINREEDTGAEGLRKAKLSYYPAFLQEKGVVRLKA